MSINFEDNAKHGRRIYTDDHGNLIGTAEYDFGRCLFRLQMNPDFCDGVAQQLNGMTAHSLAPIDTLAWAARQMADAAGY